MVELSRKYSDQRNRLSYEAPFGRSYNQSAYTKEYIPIWRVREQTRPPIKGIQCQGFVIRMQSCDQLEPCRHFRTLHWQVRGESTFVYLPIYDAVISFKTSVIEGCGWALSEGTSPSRRGEPPVGDTLKCTPTT